MINELVCKASRVQVDPKNNTNTVYINPLRQKESKNKKQQIFNFKFLGYGTYLKKN